MKDISDLLNKRKKELKNLVRIYQNNFDNESLDRIALENTIERYKHEINELYISKKRSYK